MIAQVVSLPGVNDFTLRPASLADVDAIAALMRESTERFGAAAYDARQVASALKYICRPDEQLIRDGTYFVAVDGSEVVGCGGWSRRRKVYAGSAAASGEDELLDPATDPARIRAMFVRPAWARRGIGRAILQHSEQRAAAEGFLRLQLAAMRSAGTLYESCGYHAVADAPIRLEDGVILECTLMEKALGG
ncbi:MAG TPA: GNAT family N-acetyltransferase [Thermoanaerobaculia bacterium]|nr:GNAT family N-acetyltransferase [Thermoanaerobaculia bacterium]